MNRKIIPLRVDSNFFFERAVRCLDKMNYKGAIKYFRRAVEHDPINVLNHCNLAGVLSEVGEYKESNKILFHVITHIDRTVYECYYYIANNYANMGDFTRASIYASKYLEHDEDGEFASDAEELLEFFGEYEDKGEEHDYARRLLEEEKYEEASEELQAILRDDPECHMARNNLSLAYFYMGDSAKAIAEAETLLKKDPTNLHARCNLAIFYYEQNNHVKIEQQLQYLRKITPMFEEHLYKLALTLGMLGEHELALRHFQRLLKYDIYDDSQTYFMTGVAAANAGHVKLAIQYWKKAQNLDAQSKVAAFYIEFAQVVLRENGTLDPIGYYYGLPFEEYLRKMGMNLEKDATTEVLKDPMVKFSVFWALHHSDDRIKFNVIRLLSLIFDQDVQREFEHFLLMPEENDNLKKIILILFHQIGIAGPYQAYLRKKYTEVTETQVSKMYISWKPEWIKVLELVIERLSEQDRQSTVYIADLEAIWIDFLSRKAESLPRRFQVDGWAAALEYAVYKLHNQKITQREIAEKYQVSISTLSSKYQELLNVCTRLRNK